MKVTMRNTRQDEIRRLIGYISSTEVFMHFFTLFYKRNEARLKIRKLAIETIRSEHRLTSTEFEQQFSLDYKANV